MIKGGRASLSHGKRLAICLDHFIKNGGLEFDKNEKNSALILMVIFTLSTVLYGCSGNKSGGGVTGEDNKSKGKVELTWLVRTDPNMVDWEKEMIKASRRPIRI